jgi:SAM-dependent methyltransferase
MSRRVKVSLLLTGALCLPAVLYLAMAIVNTLHRLNEVEFARDRWQRPEEILNAMNATPGGTVVDFGSGAGYMSLKLAAKVGNDGKVIAVDLRRLSLFFLSLRSLRAGFRNIHVVVGDPGDPHLPPRLDSVLICNTYHELEEPTKILRRIFASLRKDGRLVIADRAPSPWQNEHHLALSEAVSDVQAAGFDVIGRNEAFLTDPEGEPWWLLVAAKP